MKMKRGDTLLEVVFAFVIFSLVMTVAIVSMNAGLSKLQGSLELSLARTEIDAQAEALRFVHNAYVRNPNDDPETYYRLWKAITGQALDSMDDLPSLQTTDCNKLYSGEQTIYSAKAFVLNARKIRPKGDGAEETWTNSLVIADETEEIFTPAPLYPRLVYTYATGGGAGVETTTDGVLQETETYDELARAEGIYIAEVRGSDETFWDFYIFTCFNQPGATVPTTIGTTVRLYDPDF